MLQRKGRKEAESVLWEWVQFDIVKEGLTEEVASKQGSDLGEPRRSWGKRLLGRANSQCRSLESGSGLAPSRRGKEASEAGGVRKGECSGGEVRGEGTGDRRHNPGGSLQGR